MDIIAVPSDLTVNNMFISDDLLNELKRRLEEKIQLLPWPVNERVREYAVDNAGKMLRPALIVLTTMSLTDSPEKIDLSLDAAALMELLHNYTLIDDDMIDHSPLRRGKKPYYLRWGMDRAILDGDSIHAFTLHAIKELDIELLDITLRTGIDLVRGSTIELEDRESNYYDFDENRIIKIMRWKTATVFAGCVEAGFVCAGLGNEFKNLPALRDAMINGGIAFQIQDDILDVVGKQEEFGKEHLWDVQESKHGIFLYWALQTEYVDKIKEIYSKPIGEKNQEDMDLVMKVFRKVVPQVEARRDDFLLIATKQLDELRDVVKESNPDEEILFEQLKDLITYLCTRTK